MTKIICLGLLSLTVAAAAYSQTPNPPLETIVVTASRTPVALERTGSAVSVLTRSDIDERQTFSLVDVLRDVPGIAVSQSGSLGAQTQLRMRGGEANHILVLIDGVEANDPAIGDEFQFEHLLTDDIERIEIVRGPQSALWGSDAVSGVINIITKTSPKGLKVDGSVEGGSFGTFHAGGRLSFGGDDFGVGIGAGYLDTAGTNISRTGNEKDGYRNDTLDLSGHIDPKPSTRFDFVARQTQTTKQLDAIDPMTGLPTDADRLTDAKQRYLRASASFAPSASLSQNLKLTYLDTGTRNFADGSPDGDYAADKLGLYYQAHLALPGPLGHALTLAVDRKRVGFRQHGAISPFGDPNQTQHLNTAGYVAEYHVSPAKPLNLSAAVRYDASSAFRSATTYRVSVSYLREASRTHLRASAGTGQKAPTFIERFGYFPNVFLGNPNLAPETSKGWDVGIDQPLIRGRLSISATFFDQDLRNEIDGFVFLPSAGQFTARNGAGVSHRKGLELSLAATPTAALRMQASYTYTDSTQPDSARIQRPEIRRPRNTAALDVNYAFSANVELNVDASYVGPRYDTFFPPYPLTAQRRRLGSYLLLGVAASHRLTPRIEVFARIDNLLDEQYEDVIGYATPGRAVYAGVRISR